MIYTAKEIRNWPVESQGKDGKWRPARPINYQHVPVLRKLKYAFLVLLGRYDVLDWEDDTCE